MIGRRTEPQAAPHAHDGSASPAPAPSARQSHGSGLPAAAGQLDTLDSLLAALGSARCAVYSWDLRSDRMTWSPNAEALFGPQAMARMATGTGFLAISGAADAGSSHHGFKTQTGEPGSSDGTSYVSALRLSLSADGDVDWAIDQGRWFAGADGRPAVATGTVHILARQVGAMSGNTFDPLTGAPTRRHLSATLASLPQTEDARWAVMLLGLDDLGRINDRFGFEAADRVLVALAEHLRQQMKPGDLLVRFSGNKFAIVLMQVDDTGLVATGEALIESIRRTLLPIGDGQIPVSATIGAITAPTSPTHPDKIIARLQQAHELAKRRGRGRFFLDGRTDRDDVRRRINVQMADEIIQAIEHDQIAAAFQPVVHAGDRSLAFCEALARIAPDRQGHRYSGYRLVAAAEALGLMGSLDRRVLEKVVAAMEQDPGLNVSINVSATSVSDDAWMRQFQRLVTPEIGQRLILELTETIAVDHLPAARQFILKVRKAGCRIAMDDFGAGATSFRNLRKLDVDLVKIDGSFVRNMMQSEDDQTFVKALLMLARQLGIQTVAEWVQNETVAELLRDWGCDYLQGSLSGLARPLPEPQAS
ncbi:GGDEF-domain containing protein [Azorhizobium oxalatiphilum]|uniref:GGDEF-domain containing protein n=1 Tax=Azorhizobium oxalatiphilum TaxID=980631 RepID=A0A917C0F6_9HYPH|nr:GGDEF and EAL domain-containing protein [Azorhizobium oxalatiphilum]GGF64585.1 GGDEF-domain containing protein [Azorhizobium oxalatiphilum]